MRPALVAALLVAACSSSGGVLTGTGGTGGATTDGRGGADGPGAGGAVGAAAASGSGGLGVGGGAGSSGGAGAGRGGGGAGSGGSAGTDRGGGGGGGSGGAAGQGGTSALSGRGGTTPVTGSGGSGESCLSGPPQQCPLSLCGNGTLDHCMAPAGFGFCPLVPQVERCDGADLNGQTCQTVGYGAGTLACSSNCALDTKGCTECVALDASLLRCGDAPITAAAIAAGISATDSEVALAWFEVDAASKPLLGFARLTPSLDLAAPRRLTDEGTPGPIDTSVVDIRVAPLPSGWIVAGFYAPDLFFHAVSAAGEDMGRNVVSPITDLSGGLALAARPGGGPLLAWGSVEGVRVSVIASDGSSATAQALTDTGYVESGWLSAVYAGGAFYVACTVSTAASSAQLRLVRVGVDGTPGAAVDALAGVEVRAPLLVSDGTDLRVLYATLDGAPVWQRIDFTGAALGPPVSVAVGSGFTWSSAAVAVGSATAVLAFGSAPLGAPATGTTGLLGIARLADDGTIATPTKTFARAFPWAFGAVDLARRGPDLIVHWGQFDGQPRIARIGM
jgi:hypothetical protein